MHLRFLKRLTLFVSSVSFVVLTMTAVWSAERPNFIVINTDDLGYRDIGPFGSNNRTPHLDRMAREGRKLTSHYGAPVCTPSRAALMTGCYPKRALPIPHVLFPAGALGLHPDEVTVAEVLKSAGYATTCLGKWHLGDQPEFLPTKQGFETYFGLPYSNDMGPPADGAKSSRGKPLPMPRPPRPNEGQQPQGITGFNQPPLPLVENETVVGRVRGEEQTTLTGQYTDRAVAFIEENKSRPFFLYLPHTAVHFPHYPSDEFLGRSPNGLVGDWAEEVDASVGRVLDAVRAAGIEEKTLVLFTSDNGGPVQQGANNDPLRGSKGQTYEGGIRVCTIAWWPGRIPAGTSTASITSMMDVLPTFAALAGAELPADRKLDGVNIWPVLSGEDSAAPPRNEFYYFRGLSLEAVRSGDWKYHLARNELYNLADDLSESTNVAAKHPEVVARLTELADAMDKDLGRDGIGPGCRQPGRVENPLPMIDNEGRVRPELAGEQKQFP